METKQQSISDQERTALAMLRSGSSWKEASEATRVSIERLQELWALSQAIGKNDALAD